MIHTGFLGTAPDGSTTHSFYREPPGWCCANHVLALAPQPDLAGTSVHEAGHLVVDLLVGIRVIEVTLTPDKAQLPCGLVTGVSGVTQIGRVAVQLPSYLTMLAAGEQAHQRWLREAGLWTPERQWALERGARDDTAKAVAALREHHPGFDDMGYRQLYWQYRSDAEALLETHWERVHRVAEALADRRHLTGDEASELAGLPNPREPEAQSA